MYVQQLILSLIARYNSETAEFVRNIDRTLLLLDDFDYGFYKWTHQALEKFVQLSEKSHRWLKKDEDNLRLAGFEPDDFIREIDELCKYF